jgi:hypothetical protein
MKKILNLLVIVISVICLEFIFNERIDLAVSDRIFFGLACGLFIVASGSLLVEEYSIYKD